MKVAFSSHYTVHETDVGMAGNWTVVAFGPIDHGGVDGVRRALSSVMTVGPTARIGLVPNSNSRSWTYDPERVLRAVRAGTAITAADYDTEMAHMLATHDPSEPIAITLHGDHALFYLDHGIGDGQMTINLSHLIADSAARAGEVPAWASAPASRHPLMHAALRHFGTDPRRVHALLRARRASPTPTIGCVLERTPPDSDETQPTPRSVVSVSASASVETTNELSRWRDAHLPGVSISVLFFATLNIALRAEGVPADDVSTILFNVRRYLPSDRTTLANLSAGIDITLLDATDPVLLGTQWRATIASGRPISNLMLVSVKSKLGRRRHSRALTHAAPAAPSTVRVTLSDMGRHPVLEDIAFRGNGLGSYTAMVSPASENHITLVTARLHGAIRVAASFHASSVDSAAIARALDSACATPIELLESAAASRRSDRGTA